MKKDRIVAFMKNMFGMTKRVGAKDNFDEKAPVESIFLGEEASIPDYLIRMLQEASTTPEQKSI